MSPPPLCLPYLIGKVKKKNYSDDDDDDDDTYNQSELTKDTSPAVSINFTSDTESYGPYRKVGQPNHPRKLVRGYTRIKPGWRIGIDWGHGSGREDKDPLNTYRDPPPPAASPPHSAQRSSLRNSEQSNDTQPEEGIPRVPGPNGSHNPIPGNSPRNWLDQMTGFPSPPKHEESGDAPTEIAHIPSTAIIDHHVDSYPTKDAPFSYYTPRPTPTRSMSQNSKISQDSKQSKDIRDSKATKSSRGSRQSNKSQSNVSVNTLFTGSVLEHKNAYQDPIRESVHTYAQLVELRKHMTKDNLDY